MKKLLLSVIAFFMIAAAANAQVAIRTNLASLPFGALTVGAEFGLAKKWTLGVDLMANIVNPYDFYELKGGMLQVEGRYYFCEAFTKHHIGAYLLGGYYDTATLTNETVSRIIMACKYAPHLPNKARKVAFGGAGITYGYYIKLAHGWGLDLTIGGGISLARYDSPTSDRRPYTNLHYGLNRLAVDLTYKF